MEEKLWGVYNTFDNPEMFETLDEIDIWKKIDNLGGSIFWAMHDAGKPWAANVSTKDLIDAQYNLEYLVYSTRRFGVEFSKEPSAAEHVERSKSYNAWFRFWHDHFESMSPEVYNQLLIKLCDKYNITYINTEVIGKKYNTQNMNFHITSAGHNSLANSILGHMYNRKIVGTTKTFYVPKEYINLQITNNGPVGVIKDLQID